MVEPKNDQKKYPRANQSLYMTKKAFIILLAYDLLNDER